VGIRQFLQCDRLQNDSEIFINFSPDRSDIAMIASGKYPGAPAITLFIIKKNSPSRTPSLERVLVRITFIELPGSNAALILSA
jgi:hypothetical protein